MTQPHQGVWTDKFASNSIADLEDGLAHVLSLQAQRVQKQIDSEPPEDAKLRAEHEKQIDKNLDKVFKNGQSLLLTKRPRPTAARPGTAIESQRVQLPTRPDGRLIAQALSEMEQRSIEAGYEFDRERITDDEIWDWLAARGDVMPRTREQRAIESAF